MRVYELMDNIEFQSEITFCRYNYKTDKLEILTEEAARDLEVRYMYTNPEIYIECESVEDFD